MNQQSDRARDAEALAAADEPDFLTRWLSQAATISVDLEPPARSNARGVDLG